MNEYFCKTYNLKQLDKDKMQRYNKVNTATYRDVYVISLKKTIRQSGCIFILPYSLDRLFILLSVSEGRVHAEHPVWSGWFIWVVQTSSTVHITTVHLHHIHGGIRIGPGAGWL